LKFNDSNICIDSLSDHNHVEISKQQNINRQELDNNLKRIVVDNMFTRLFKIIHSELQNTYNEMLTRKGPFIQISRPNIRMNEKYLGSNLHKKFKMGRDLL